MKVLMVNGSPRVNGNTAVALREMEKVFSDEKYCAWERAVWSSGKRGESIDAFCKIR